MRLKIIAENANLAQRLQALRPILAAAAQKAYDEWQQDESGLDELLGGGGICDIIAEYMAQILNNNGIEYTEGGHDGDDHAFLIAYDDDSSYSVNIPPHVYESGGGLNWNKLPNVVFSPDMIEIHETWRPDWIDDNLP